MWIESLHIEGGVLRGFDQRFDRWLNVLVGGGGTELLRFCLGATSYTDTGQQEATEHALDVLGDGRVTVKLTDGKQRIEISRMAQDVDPVVAVSVLGPQTGLVVVQTRGFTLRGSQRVDGLGSCFGIGPSYCA